MGHCTVGQESYSHVDDVVGELAAAVAVGERRQREPGEPPCAGGIPCFSAKLSRIEELPAPLEHVLHLVGVGGRLYTNFGPVRLDVATPIGRRRGESRFSIYVSIGQAF